MNALPALPRFKLKRPSPHIIFSCGLLGVLAVGVVDRVTPARLSLMIFYVVGSVVVGWGSGKRAAAVVSLVSSVLLVTHDWALYGQQPGLGITLWNLFTRLCVIFGGGWVAAEVTRLTRNLGRLVEQRTADWKAEAERHQTTSQRMAEALDLARMAHWEYDVATGLFTFDDRFFRLYGSSLERERTRQMSAEAYVREFVFAEDAAMVLKNVERTLMTTDPNFALQLEHRIQRRDGTVGHVAVRVALTRDAQGRTVKIHGVNQDVTERKRLEGQILEISDREQARIGQDLHDGLCQQLVSLAFDANSLEQRLADKAAPEAATAKRLADLLDQSISEARQLSRGLFPIRLEGDGLSSALEELARNAQERFQVHCRFRSQGPIAVKDTATATHLFRIAQEAVNNALKHAKPSRITIELSGRPGAVELAVEDDGRGLPAEGPRNPGGMGLHIMDYRARAIGADLQVGAGTWGGTRVTCSFN